MWRSRAGKGICGRIVRSFQRIGNLIYCCNKFISAVTAADIFAPQCILYLPDIRMKENFETIINNNERIPQLLEAAFTISCALSPRMDMAINCEKSLEICRD
ncbi:MAG: hypothetical protein SO445_07715 [Lachnospiraceae bacterium]|nr:hypothetical protein [Lachnospiraceae bacterium]MDD7377645.1 hypothetical protein [Lachnospiraceae bacterium]MDY4617578.1 hypothetical protein [Lachnospiraceae bacterium]